METEIREARFEDLPRIIRMIDEDDLGTTGDRYTEPLMKFYEDAFREITEDKNSIILVICVCGSVFGSLQLTFKGVFPIWADCVQLSKMFMLHRICRAGDWAPSL